jgi:hypothetical protein
VSNLQKAIKELYNGEISEMEAKSAEDNLLQFFKLLQKIDARQERQIPNRSNEDKNENNGSSN